MATDATQEENARQLIKTTLEKIQAFNDTLNALRDEFRNTELLRELTERDQEILNMPLDKLGFEGMARRLVLEKGPVIINEATFNATQSFFEHVTQNVSNIKKAIEDPRFTTQSGLETVGTMVSRFSEDITREAEKVFRIAGGQDTSFGEFFQGIATSIKRWVEDLGSSLKQLFNFSPTPEAAIETEMDKKTPKQKIFGVTVSSTSFTEQFNQMKTKLDTNRDALDKAMPTSPGLKSR